jgi:hypothetical protein
VPRDRLQSAKEWYDLIADKALSADRSSKAISTAAPKNSTTDLGRMLSRIVEETNEEVEKSRPIEVEPAPIAVAAVPQQNSRPSWADEFNEESLVEPEAPTPEPVAEFDEPQEPVLAAEVQPMPVKRSATDADYNQPNWALRVIERTEKSRLLEQQALQAEAEANKPKGQAQEGSMFALKDDFEMSDDVFVSRGMIEPLAKYLVTGIVLGLASLLFFPNLL